MENKVNSFMGIPNNILTKYPEIDSHSILLGYRGSIAHGTHLPKKDPFSVDDIDIIGICIPPIDCYFGLKEFYSKGTREIMEGEYDIVLFELRKAIRLLEEGNPNVATQYSAEQDMITDLVHAKLHQLMENLTMSK